MSGAVSGDLGWPGLASSDPAAALRFYGDLLDCDARPARGGVTLLGDADGTFAVVYAQTPQARAAGVTPHWTPFVSVRDAGAAQAAAVRLGAFALREPFDAAGMGRIAPIRDPAGATVSLWQSEAGADLDAGEGRARCRHELLTGDPARSCRFYAALFGWSVHDEREAPATLAASGRALAAVRPVDDPGAGGSGWVPGFAVADVHDRRRRAERLGARALEPLGTERSAWFRDPQGAVFWLFEPDERAWTARARSR